MKKLLFSGELPPKSMHGVGHSNEINISFLRKKFRVIIDEEIVPYKLHNKLSIAKTANFCKRIVRIIFLSLCNRFSYFYIVFSTSTVGALKTFILLLTFKCFNRSKVVVHIHRGDLAIFISSKSINRLIFSMVTRLTDKYIVLSKETQDYIFRNFPNIEVAVLNNTINTEYSFEKTQKKEISLIQFIYLSNYIEEKGILLLLEVFKDLPENFILNCYGNFTDLTLKEKIMSFNSANILVNGPIDGESKYQKINQSDALILPSYNEGKPLVLLEAMSVGTVFIASNVGYISEIVYDNYPYLYYPNNKNELRKSIIQFSNDKKTQQISKVLYKRYKALFSHEVHRKRLLEVFNE